MTTSTSERLGIWSLEEAIDQMREWRVGPIREWLEVRLAGDGGPTPRDLAALEAATWWNDQGTSVATSQLPEWLGWIARQRPDTLAPFVLYVRFAAMLAWELAWEVRPILAVLEATDGATRRQLQRLGPDQRLLVEGCLAVLGFLRTEIKVFPQANVGGLDDWARAALVASEEARLVAGVASGMPEGPVRNYVSTCVSEEIEYYGSIGQAAAEVASIGRTSRVAASRALELAIERLRAAELGEDDIDSSELRAHRMSLTRLRGALELRWLRVDHGRYTIVCPFGVAGIAPRDVVALGTSDGFSWHLAGLPVVSVRESLPISDIWNSVDPLARSFSGAALRLPEVQIVRDDGTVEHTLRPELWLSTLGNHVLLLETDIEDALPPKLYDSLKLASADFCHLDLSGRSIRPIVGVVCDRSWDAPADFVLDVMDSLNHRVGQRNATAMVAYGPGRTTGVLLIDRVSSWDPGSGQGTPLESAAEIDALFGHQLLSNPLDANLSAICQWAQYPDNPDSRLLLTAMGPAFVAHTPNSNSIAALGSPSYILNERRDCFVFAASLQGLFQGWYTELARHNERMSARLHDISHVSEASEAVGRITSAGLKEFEDTLGSWHVQLQDFIARCRTTLLFIESPTLVQSPVIRSLLDALLERNGYSDVSRQFLGSAESLASDRLETVLHNFRDHIQELEEAARARRERRSRLLLESLLAGVAVAGMSGVASLVQTGYGLGPRESDLLVALVILLSMIIAVWVWWSNRDPR